MSSPCSIRLPSPLRERIVARAHAERRTFSNAVVVLLEDALDAREEAVVDVLVNELDVVERDGAA